MSCQLLFLLVITIVLVRQVTPHMSITDTPTQMQNTCLCALPEYCLLTDLCSDDRLNERAHPCLEDRCVGPQALPKQSWLLLFGFYPDKCSMCRSIDWHPGRGSRPLNRWRPWPVTPWELTEVNCQARWDSHSRGCVQMQQGTVIRPGTRVALSPEAILPQLLVGPALQGEPLGSMPRGE